MRTVTYRLEDLENLRIDIGFVGENEHSKVRIDCLKAFTEYPNAVPAMSVTPPIGESYPAVVERNGDYVEWVVADSDLSVSGSGEAQLSFVQDEVIMKSYKFCTKIHKSIVPTGEAPDPLDDFITRASAALADIPQTIDDALEQAKESGEFKGDPGEDGYTPVKGVDYFDGQDGQDGADGKDGEDGQDGTDGFSPTVTVTDITGGHRVVITDATGDHPFDVMDGQGGGGTVTVDDELSDTSTNPVQNKVITAEVTSLKEAIAYKTPEMFGAKGDGTTDDSEAVQAACNAGYEVRFSDNKTYYIADTITIDHDCHLIGGENTVIKTKTPQGGSAPNGIVVTGTLKKTTTLTSNYSAVGTSTNNAGNRFELSDMTGIGIGDIMVITAEDQYFNYNRQYYYLGATLLVADKDDDYLYTCDAIPWDIENTENVSVKIYSAPTAIIENLNFKMDSDTSGSYHYCLMLNWCKNTTVKNCIISEMDNGVRLWECVNTLVDCISMSKTPGAGEVDIDHYGISIYSCSNTTVSRVAGECANSCVDLSGHTPSMNTYVKNCMLFSANRTSGLGMHESAYNTIVSDCVIGGMIGYGVLTVERCRFVQHRKIDNSDNAITYRGSHKAEWAKLKMSDCIFEGENLAINFPTPQTQNGIQAYNHVIGEIMIRDCVGGRIISNATTNEAILSNTINRIILDNWRNCYEFYHIGNKVKSMLVNNCNFTYPVWCNKHSGSFSSDGIENLHVVSFYPQEDKLFIETDSGTTYFLPKNTPIVFTSSNESDHFAVCGKNVASNIVADYSVGDVGGNTGAALSRSVNNNFASALSTNANGELVFTQPNNLSTSTATYQKCLIYVAKRGRVRMSVKLKNTGATNATSWRPYIAIVDADTMKVSYRGNGTGVTTTADGVVATHYRDVPANSFVLCYLYCYSPVLSAETTFSDYVVNIMEDDFIVDTITFEKYDGSGRDGSGTLYSVDGINYIMANAAGSFTAKFKANLLE